MLILLSIIDLCALSPLSQIEHNELIGRLLLEEPKVAQELLTKQFKAVFLFLLDFKKPLITR